MIESQEIHCDKILALLQNTEVPKTFCNKANHTYESQICHDGTAKGLIAYGARPSIVLQWFVIELMKDYHRVICMQPQETTCCGHFVSPCRIL